MLLAPYIVFLHLKKSKEQYFSWWKKCFHSSRLTSVRVWFTKWLCLAEACLWSTVSKRWFVQSPVKYFFKAPALFQTVLQWSLPRWVCRHSHASFIQQLLWNAWKRSSNALLSLSAQIITIRWLFNNFDRPNHSYRICISLFPHFSGATRYCWREIIKPWKLFFTVALYTEVQVCTVDSQQQGCGLCLCWFSQDAPASSHSPMTCRWTGDSEMLKGVTGFVSTSHPVSAGINSPRNPSKDEHLYENRLMDYYGGKKEYSRCLVHYI